MEKLKMSSSRGEIQSERNRNLNFELKVIIDLLGKEGYEKYGQYVARKFGKSYLIQYSKYYETGESALFAMLETGNIKSYTRICERAKHFFDNDATVDEKFFPARELAVLKFFDNEVSKAKQKDASLEQVQ